MPFDFPSSPTAGQIFTPPGGPTYRLAESALAGAQRATAETRSRIVNGAMQISQENGNTAGPAAAISSADQWHCLVHDGGMH